MPVQWSVVVYMVYATCLLQCVSPMSVLHTIFHLVQTWKVLEGSCGIVFSQHHQAPQLDFKIVVIDRKATSNCGSLFLPCSFLTVLRPSILYPTPGYPFAFTDKLPSRPHNVMCYAEHSISMYITAHASCQTFIAMVDTDDALWM